MTNADELPAVRAAMTVFKFADGSTTDDKVSLWPWSNRDSKTFLLTGLEHKQLAMLGLD